MAKYIDADRLKEELQKRFDICKRVSEDDRNALDTQDWYRGKYTAYSECLSFIDSLQQEQPEVDLEKEIEKELRSHYNDDQDVYWWNYLKNSFHHFYELGRKDEREQMMKEAVEADVFDFSSSLPKPYAHISLPQNKYHTGDKVRIIIVKED